MIPATLAGIAEATGGTLADVGNPSALVDGPVVADSRDARPGALFVAVRGERVDGHEFAADAVGAGAAGVLATRPLGVPAIIVPDVVEALARLARQVHDALPDLTTIGITGSSGKTSTKDLVAAVLRIAGGTVAAPESYNNEIGHPLTVLGADRTTRHLVLELSARGAGHIAHLARIAPLRIGVVLNVGTAHVGEFGSRDAIAQAKGELVESLPEGGVAVLSADDPYVTGMAARTRARVVTFGRAPDADVQAAGLRLDAAGRAEFVLHTPAGSGQVRLRLHGEHHVQNALAAAAVAIEVGMDVREVAAELSSATPVSRWRMAVKERADGVTVVNDAYNANPESMAAALRALVAIAGERRTWAVLGEMTELGEATAQAHHDTGALLAQLGIHQAVTVGTGAEPVARAAREAGIPADRVVTVPELDAALALLRRDLRAGDVVLVKASRVVGLERLALALQDEPSAGEVTA